MKFLGNILWLIMGGLVVSLYYALMGILFCITVIGIPFGLQLIKMAGLALWPFGRDVQSDTNDGGCLAIIMNVIWIIFSVNVSRVAQTAIALDYIGCFIQ